MQPCPSCSQKAPRGSRFCPACAAPLEDPAASLTRTSAESEQPTQAEPPSHPFLDRSRFVPGSVLDKRYRIVGLLGRGGMGEVYRADDMKLGQPVALKFLPQGLDRDEQRRSRFLNEVRTARQVTHSNVCRVYDIGEVDGQHYLSMEYVDGEDLSSLLRRIGRLPRDKALQIARQLCAGVQAAHEEGILHRDLKPANVMIDGRGRVKITDFGLASLEETIQEGEIRFGTPAYMAPEQLAGKEVTVRSDIYALGLVLYELFTGKQAFEAATPEELARLHSDSAPSKPSDHVEGFDPTVEKAILRCLEKEPRERPDSALEVSASLPGGDPLAAALAAGETPSPQMVADAGEGQGLRPWVALVCVILTVAGLVGSAFFFGRQQLISQVGLEKPPAVLAAEARGLLEALGHDPGLDRAHGFATDEDYIAYVDREKTPVAPSTVQPAPIHFWYRESPRYLAPMNGVEAVTYSDPPVQLTGMANVRLDARGRLLELLVIPPEVDEAEQPWPEPDWRPLLKTAGFAPEALRPVRPVRNALVDADRRAAWEGTYPGQDAIPVRVEAAAYHGKPVFFQVVLPWTRATRMEEARSDTGATINKIIAFALLLAVLIGGFLLARRNLRLGRGDRQGALRLSVFVFCAMSFLWVSSCHFVADWSLLLWFVRTVSNGLFFAFVYGMVYLAGEPYARRLWPQLLISWGRLLEGRFRDPRIGRDILIGGVAAALTLPLMQGFIFGARDVVFADPNLVTGPRMLLAGLVMLVFGPILWSVPLLTALLIFRILVRRQWIAVAVLFVVLTVAGGAAESEASGWAIALSLQAATTAIYLLVLVRFGLLAIVFLRLFFDGCVELPIVLGSSGWYAGYSLAYLLALIALAIYGFTISLGGRRVFSERFLEAEAGR